MKANRTTTTETGSTMTRAQNPTSDLTEPCPRTMSLLATCGLEGREGAFLSDSLGPAAAGPGHLKRGTFSRLGKFATCGWLSKLWSLFPHIQGTKKGP